MGQQKVSGLSHIVFSCEDLKQAAVYFAELGYHQLGEASGANPRAKAPFFCGALPESYEMQLFARNGYPPAELLHDLAPEPRAAGLADTYELHLGNQVVAGACQIGSHQWLQGQPAGVADSFIILQSPNPAQTAEFWRNFDVPIRQTENGTVVEIRKSIVGASVDLIIVANAEICPSSLNSIGISCLSFFVFSPNRVRESLLDSDCEVGELFSLSPFGRPLEIFFVRNATGELYEFISIR